MSMSESCDSPVYSPFVRVATEIAKAVRTIGQPNSAENFKHCIPRLSQMQKRRRKQASKGRDHDRRYDAQVIVTGFECDLALLKASAAARGIGISGLSGNWRTRPTGR